jgi:hypothetical protein
MLVIEIAATDYVPVVPGFDYKTSSHFIAAF